MQTQKKRVLLGLRKFVVMTLFLSLIVNGIVHSQKAYAAEPSAPIDVNHSLGVASNFNAFILNNMTMPNTDSEGRLAVGNSLNVSSYGIASKLSNNNDVNLVVGNELHYQGGELKGRFVIGENSGVAPIIDVSDYLRTKQMTDKKVSDVQDFIDNQVASFAEAKAQLIGISQSYQGYTASQPNGAINKSGSRLTFSYSGSSDFVVFSLPSSEFSQAGEVNFDVPRGKTIVVNITGATINWPGGQQFYQGTGMNYGDSQAAKILFNFPDATTINLGNIGIFGSVLAPKATVNASWGQLNGTLVANNFNNTSGSMEVHFALFKPTLPPTTVLGKVTVKKVDAANPDKTLAGAEFELQKKDGDSWTKVATLITGVDGTVSKSDLALGTYRLVETKAPSGYEKGTNPAPFELTKGDNEKTVTVENNEIPILGKVIVKKVDASNPDKTLAGAEFELQKKDGESWTKVATLITGVDGTVSKSNLALGTYRLVETKAPEGYEKGETPPSFDLTKGSNEKTFTIKNAQIPEEVTGSLSLKKVDSSNPDQTLESAVFNLQQLKNGEWETLYTLTTDSKGMIEKSGLELGTYRFVEKTAPTGYALSAKTEQVTLTQSDPKATVIFENTKTPEEVFGSVSLKKVDSSNPDQTLEGAVFDLQQLNEKGEWNTLYTLTTDGKGEVEKSGLELGTYRFVEKIAPTGYVLLSKTEQVTLTQSDPKVTVIFENTKIPEEVFGSVSLKKVDSSNPAQTLEGAVFELQQLNEKGEWNAFYTLTTDNKGKVEKVGLKLGTYRFVEKTAPTGYALSAKTEQFSLTQGNPNFSVTFENTKIPEEVFGSVSLKKVDSSNPAQTLEGAVFELQQFKDGKWEKVATLTTDIKGEIEKSGLELGTYRWVENQAPAGYSPSSKAEQFNLTQSNPMFSITIENTKIPETVTPAPPIPSQPSTPSQPTLSQQPLIERGVMGEKQAQEQPTASASDDPTPPTQAVQAPALQRGFLAETQYSVPTEEHALPVTGDNSNPMAYWFGALLLLAAGIIGFAGRRKTKKTR
jgi:choice-of-anchor A domain-containing protein/LPXTG-motif cell wall-anchored protein